MIRPPRVSRARTRPVSNGVALNGHYAPSPVSFFTLFTSGFTRIVVRVRQRFRRRLPASVLTDNDFATTLADPPTSGGQGRNDTFNSFPVSRTLR